MPAFSCFTAFGLLEFSSEPSDAEKVYTGLVAAYAGPDGLPTIDTAPGTYKEAQLYGWAMAIGAARATLRRAGNELRPETSYSQLAAHEERFHMSPGPDDDVPTRRAALAAKQKAARGPRREAVWDGLSAILGPNLVAYRPIATGEAEAYPADPSLPTSPGIFRRNDAVAKSVRLLDAVARCGPRQVTCDKWDETHTTGSFSLGHPSQNEVGQSFLGDGGTLDKAVFFVKKSGSPTGFMYAKVYAHTGTFGAGGLPTGPVLATSGPLDVAALTTSYALTTFAFSGADRIRLVAGTPYFVVVDFTTAGSGFVVLSPGTLGHAGNTASLFVGAWTAATAFDMVFYVKTVFDMMEVEYENWNRSLVAVEIVAGDVLCVDPGSWGLAERVSVLSSTSDGTTRTLTATFVKPHSAGVMATTGPMPLWTNSKRHVLVVVKAAAAVDPTAVRRINELLRRIMRGPTTWAIVQPTTPGAATVGPFAIGDTSGSPLGAVPLESITL